MPLNQKVNNVIENDFMVRLERAPFKEPVAFCFACFCVPCAAYHQREVLLELVGEEYLCCGGVFPVGPLRNPQPKFPCLLLESVFCPWMAISANRYIVQTRFGRRNGRFDDAIVTFAALFCNVVNILCVLANFEMPEELAATAYGLVLCAMGCMHAQNVHEIKKIIENGYEKPPRRIVLALPPVQQDMINNASTNVGTHVVGAQVQVVCGRPVQQKMI